MGVSTDDGRHETPEFLLAAGSSPARGTARSTMWCVATALTEVAGHHWQKISPSGGGFCICSARLWPRGDHRGPTVTVGGTATPDGPRWHL